jgi:epoxide hydrolase-like predicted phosphatase
MDAQPDSIRTIIFDLGGVYFSDGTKRAINIYSSKYGLDKQEVKDQLIGKLGSDWRMGKLTAEQFWSQFKERWRLDVSSEELTGIWFEGYELNQGTESVVLALRRGGYELIYLSDNVPDRVEYLERRHHFIEKFSGGVFSFEIGVRKPNILIYEKALEKTSSPPNRCVYVDDIESFLRPAASLGMKTIHFRSSEQLTEDLYKLGVHF